MNSAIPANIFGGTWIEITDRFLYCANSSKTTGGSSTISTSHLPAHTNTFNGNQATDTVQIRGNLDLTIISEYANNGIFSSIQNGGDSWGYYLLRSSAKTDLLTWA